MMGGAGGQGLVLAGTLLAQAAIKEGKNVVQTQTYGIAQRGGFSAAEVIIDSSEILYQQVEKPDVIIVLSESAVAKFRSASELILYDSTLLQVAAASNWHGIPFTHIAGGAANLAALGAMLATRPIVCYDSLAAVIRERFAPPAADRNVEAVRKGMTAAESYWKGV